MTTKEAYRYLEAQTAELAPKAWLTVTETREGYRTDPKVRYHAHILDLAHHMSQSEDTPSAAVEGVLSQLRDLKQPKES